MQNLSDVLQIYLPRKNVPEVSLMSNSPTQVILCLFQVPVAAVTCPFIHPIRSFTFLYLMLLKFELLTVLPWIQQFVSGSPKALTLSSHVLSLYSYQRGNYLGLLSSVGLSPPLEHDLFLCCTSGQAKEQAEDIAKRCKD